MKILITTLIIVVSLILLRNLIDYLVTKDKEARAKDRNGGYGL